MVDLSFTVHAGAAHAVAAQMRPERLERILIKSMEKAMVPVVQAIRIRAPVGTTSVTRHHLAGYLKRSIRFRVDTRRGLRARILAAPHGHLVEQGHRLVRGGKQVGRVAAHPFARPVVESMTPEIEQAISKEIEQALTMAARIGQATGYGL